MRTMLRASLPAAALTLLLALAFSSTAHAVSQRTLIAPTGAAASDQFGWSVGTAGDVNGDGYADVIVGAYYAGGGDFGRAYVYFGGPAADAVADLTLTGAANYDHFGASVGTAGDLNGDGYADVIVGAPFNAAGGTDAGRAYVFFGGPGADAIADLTLTGAAAGDLLGWSVGTAGDVNGDGYADVIVGASGNDAGGTNAGRAYIYFGGPGADAVADLTLTGAAAGDAFGCSVGAAGDVNGDGHADLIVGAYLSDAGGTSAGRAYIFYGGPGADAVADLTLNGAAAGDLLGSSVGPAGDVNGDGYADVIVGAYLSDAGGTSAGRAYVYYGGPGADDVADLTLTGAAGGDWFGYSAGAAGDVNGDGYADVIVGAHYNDAGGADAGRAYIYYGGPGADDVADLTLTGAAGGDWFGYSAGAAGDVNGDGYADVIVGAILNDAGALQAGRAYVYAVCPYQVLSPNGGEQWVTDRPATVRWLGHDVADLALSTDGGLSYTTLASGIGGANENEFTLLAPAVTTTHARVRLTYTGQASRRSTSDASDGVFSIVAPHQPPGAASRLALTLTVADALWLGRSVGPAGDVNRDGYADFIVGAPGPDEYAVDPGRAYLYYGGPAGDATADLTLTGAALGDNFGYSVGSAGDVNGDGYGDLIVGAWGNDAGGTEAGRAYVYFGGPAADATADLTLTGAAAGDVFGISVGTAGDVNGDGYADLIVGAPGNAGRAYVYYGGPAADATADLTLTGAAAGDAFGRSVGTAGDVNGDGYADLIVAAQLSSAGGINAGRVYVYYGGRVADATADLVMTGAAAFDQFGCSVGTAGDVNGDGYADFIVGAEFNDAGGFGAGQAYLYYGGAAADASADLTLTGAAAGDQFGFSVGTAGDVNSDGYADLIVGAAYNDAGGAEAGRIYVYFGGPGADATADLTLTGAAAGDRLGSSVATAGDVEGDGFADLIVGVIGNGGPGRAEFHDCGRYFVLAPNGGESWLAGTSREIRWRGSEPADLWLSADGGATYQSLLSNVGRADSNLVSLTVPDLETSAALVRITAHDPALTGSDVSDGVFRITRPRDPPAMASVLARTFVGEAASDEMGTSVAAAGDVNGDGYGDVIVAARGNDAGGANAGRAYVHFGGPGADTVADLTFTGAAADDGFGVSVAAAGDVNGDGYGDVIVGAPLNDAAALDAGRAYVYFGGPGADAIADLTFTGSAEFDYFGWSVAGAGDVNGDGCGDLIVGAYGNDAAGPYCGAAFVYFGGFGADAIPDLVLTGAAANDFFGHSVAGAGDVNGDGYADVIVGAWGSDAGGTDAGRAYVYFGGRGADTVADLTLTGAAAGDWFGRAVAGAGDIDGDGWADVIVGAPQNDAGGLDAGRAYVYLGGPAAADVADLTLTGVDAYDWFGASVAGAGDVNGDGFGDLLVGADGNDTGGNFAGRAYVWFGGPGADAITDLTFTGAAAGDRFGGSVSGAGDIDGDGFGDLVFGATLNDAAGSNAGAAHFYACSRYVVTAPNGGDIWNVGATRTVSWLGAEPADLWLSVDGGARYELLASNVGGAENNAMPLRVPHTPTRFARIRLTPHDAGISGADASDSLFTIQTSVALLAFIAAPAPEGGALLTWSTNPGVGPEGLAGWRLYRRAAGETGPGTRVGPELLTEPRYTDAAATAGCSWRLTAVNGLQEELELGTVALEEPPAGLRAWPSPLVRGAPLTVAFPAPTGAAGAPVSDLDVGVFDVNGRRVATLARGQLALPPSGAHRLTWAGGAAPGIYFVRVSAPSAGLGLERKVVVMP